MTAAIADWFGVAGHRFGAPATVAGLAAIGAIATFLARVRPRTWIPAVALSGAIAGGVLVERAPWSAPRLEDALDDLEHINGFEVVSTDHAGSGTCRPMCPSVTRVYRAPDTSPQANVLTMSLSLSEAGLLPPAHEMGGHVMSDHMSARGEHANVVIAAQRLDEGGIRVTVVLAARR